jgi:predicted DNA-binding transcriptional regulator AlpA
MTTNGTIENLRTCKQAAAFLTVSEKTLEAWRSQNRGPRFIKLGRRVAYRMEDLVTYSERHTVATTQ